MQVISKLKLIKPLIITLVFNIYNIIIDITLPCDGTAYNRMPSYIPNLLCLSIYSLLYCPTCLPIVSYRPTYTQIHLHDRAGTFASYIYIREKLIYKF